MNIAWVIGRGGLLGTALERALERSGTVLFVPERSFPWSDADATVSLMQREIGRFAEAVASASSWEIYWAAGVGTMGSAAASMTTEALVLQRLTEGLAMVGLPIERGRFAFASSAGAIYAGATDDIIDERSPIGPTTDYARAKLAQEATVRHLVDATAIRALVCRISTLYGVAQTVGKAQGLLTHISRCIVRNQTITIFVPLDTIRDYIGADDAAAVMIDALRGLDAPGFAMKIIASERPTTISEILSIFRRLSRRAPRIVTTGTATSAVYPRRIQYRSLVPGPGASTSTSLLLGIDRILTAERRRYVAGEAAAR